MLMNNFDFIVRSMEKSCG